MTNPRLLRNGGIAAAISLALVAGACGGGDTDVATSLGSTVADTAGPDGDTDAPATTDGGGGAAPTPSAASEGEPAGPNELPDVTVLDVATGEEVALASFAPADRPLLLWMWAPH